MSATLRAHPRGADVAAILHAAVAAADPYAAVSRHLQRDGDTLRAGTTSYDLRRYERVLLLAVGKAAIPMAQAALDVLDGRVADGLIVTKAADTPAPNTGPLPIVAAAHPLPDERSVYAGEQALALLQAAGEHDLVLVLLSGGGSALLTLPEAGLTLNDMRALTGALLASGATIDEINALRRRCDRVKGGGLAGAAYPATVAVLVLSDVVGDDLHAIASGPFVVPEDGQIDPLEVVERYGLRVSLPSGAARLLEAPPPVVAPAQRERVQHTIIANVEAAANGALAAAQARGFETELLTTTLRGEARVVGGELARRLVDREHRGPSCSIAGGETTVTLRGDGLGGRNQELALAAVTTLAGRHDRLLVSLATDGGDGPTDAAGAVVGGETLARGHALGLDPQHFLDHNDAYHYFEALGDLLQPGPTHTNVNDLVLLFTF